MARFKPIDRKKASEQVAEQIRSSILGGLLRPGQRLPSERDLAAQFEVTRTTLREALKKLEGLKLIFIRHGDRATVLDYMRHGSIELLNDLAGRKNRINVGLLENVLEARVVIGVEATRLAARRRSEDDLLNLDEALLQLEHASQGEDGFRELEFDFFHTISTASHNLVFVFLFNSIRSLYLGNSSYFEPLVDAPEAIVENHRRIIEAVRGQDADAAAGLARLFLEEGMERVLAHHRAPESADPDEESPNETKGLFRRRSRKKQTEP